MRSSLRMPDLPLTGRTLRNTRMIMDMVLSMEYPRMTTRMMIMMMMMVRRAWLVMRMRTSLRGLRRRIRDT